MDFVARPLEVVERCCLELQQQAQQAGKEADAGQGCPSLHAHVAEAFRGAFTQRSTLSFVWCRQPFLTSPP